MCFARGRSITMQILWVFFIIAFIFKCVFSFSCTFVQPALTSCIFVVKPSPLLTPYSNCISLKYHSNSPLSSLSFSAQVIHLIVYIYIYICSSSNHWSLFHVCSSMLFGTAIYFFFYYCNSNASINKFHCNDSLLLVAL